MLSFISSCVQIAASLLYQFLALAPGSLRLLILQTGTSAADRHEGTRMEGSLSSKAGEVGELFLVILKMSTFILFKDVHRRQNFSQPKENML